MVVELVGGRPGNGEEQRSVAVSGGRDKEDKEDGDEAFFVFSAFMGTVSFLFSNRLFDCNLMVPLLDTGTSEFGEM